MSSEDLEKYEAEMELQLYREYRDVVGLFSYVVETERRFYLTNHGPAAVPPRTAKCTLRSPCGSLGLGHVSAGQVRRTSGW